MVEPCANAEPISRLEELERENANFRTWGIIEVAVRNPSVSEYMEHWEGRATKAEAEIASLQERIRELEGAGLTDAERLGAWATEGPKLAAKAGCYVEIKISPARAALKGTKP